jgi:hypothetical protein
MKSNAVPSFYFSAYPLKALKLPADEMEAYNQLSKKSILKVNTNLRVLPMTNPSKGVRKMHSKIPKKPGQNSEPQGLEWYNNYE